MLKNFELDCYDRNNRLSALGQRFCPDWEGEIVVMKIDLGAVK